MKAINFAKRNFKEIIRDPISIIFSFLLPLFLLWIFQQFKIPEENFKVVNFTPGILIFSFSFISLFTASLVASDRSTSLITRLSASPMKISDYIFGYLLAILPIAIMQNILFFILAIILGLEFSSKIILAMLISLPICILFICLGIIVGCVTSSKAAGGVGSIIVQLVAFTSGMYFSIELVGKVFKFICNILPFSHSVNILKSTLYGRSINNLDIVVIIIYIIITLVISCILLNKRLRSDNK